MYYCLMSTLMFKKEKKETEKETINTLFLLHSLQRDKTNIENDEKSQKNVCLQIDRSLLHTLNENVFK